MQFSDLNLIEPLLRVLDAEGYKNPTPIQAQSIPSVLAGKDVLGIAQTGTGKTAAFALPTLQRLAQSAPDPIPVQQSHNPRREPARGRFDRNRRDQRPTRNGGLNWNRKIRCLIVAPTRELANQILESFRVYGKYTHLRSAAVYGGVGFGNQIRDLRDGVDVLIACPGRLLDLIRQGYADLSHVETLILDEADRMLDMGFTPDIRKICELIPAKRQTLLFTATMPPEIQRLADDLLTDAVRIQIARVSQPAELVEHATYFVAQNQKIDLLRHLLNASPADLPGAGGARVLVFTRTRRSADRVAERLGRNGLAVESIHGDKSQNARDRALRNFKSGRCPVLVATDVAARGLDVDGISHVINYDLPNEAETFVHRIGRTGRAGADGIAVSFCDVEECGFLVSIEKLIGSELPRVTEHPHHCSIAEAKLAQRLTSTGPSKRKFGGAPGGNRKGRRGPWSNNRPSGNGGGGYRGQRPIAAKKA